MKTFEQDDDVYIYFLIVFKDIYIFFGGTSLKKLHKYLTASQKTK